MSNTLSGTDLHVFRGERHVLRGVSFTVTAGQCLEVVGPNGAGKTSLLRTVVGLVNAESGCVAWNGRDIRADARAYHSVLAFLGHDSPLKADLTGAENLRFATGLRRGFAPGEIDGALAEVGAAGFAQRAVRTLSAGQRRRVALAALVLAAVPLWIVDEPATNLDAEGHALVARLIAQQLARGGVVVAAVHQSLPIEPAHVRRLVLDAR